MHALGGVDWLWWPCISYIMHFEFNGLLCEALLPATWQPAWRAAFCHVLGMELNLANGGSVFAETLVAIHSSKGGYARVAIVR